MCMLCARWLHQILMGYEFFFLPCCFSFMYSSVPVRCLCGRFPTASVSLLCTAVDRIEKQKAFCLRMHVVTKSSGGLFPKKNWPIHFLWCYRQLLGVDFSVKEFYSLVWSKIPRRELKWQRCGRISSFQIRV